MSINIQRGAGLGLPLNGADKTVSAINLKDYGEITNAIGGTGGGTQSINLTLGNVVTATQDTSATTFTFDNPTASDEGCSFTLFLTNGGSNSGIVWPGSVTWITNGGYAPVLQASGVDICTFTTVDGGTIWYGYSTGSTRQMIFSSHAKVGATSGFVVGAADDIGYLATAPASQSASTLVIPISGLEVGDIITTWSIVGQIESAGNTVTIDGDLRVHTAAAAQPTDASVGAITQLSKTADYLVNDSKTGLTHTVANNQTFYVLVTVTTAASTDVVILGTTVTVG